MVDLNNIIEHKSSEQFKAKFIGVKSRIYGMKVYPNVIYTLKYKPYIYDRGWLWFEISRVKKGLFGREIEWGLCPYTSIDTFKSNWELL